MTEKYTKVVQCDARGQIVIPKGVRKKLKLGEGSAFWIYEIEGGIFLKKIEESPSKDEIKKAVRKKL